MLSSLFAQFRQQYANGSLTTELLMTHAEQYVIKATVTIGEQTVATALAADQSLTVADDQAKTRVLSMLGFAQITSQETRGDVTQPVNEPSSTDAFQAPAANLTSKSGSLPAISEISSPAVEPDIDDSEDIGRPIDSITPDEAPAPSEVPASSLAAVAIKNFDDTNPVDLSDIIAQTDVEMARLGWSSLQGRDYLEKTFSKRSRQQLTDEEILTFLLYLESQPTPSMG